jgi:hypothetical protein
MTKRHPASDPVPTTVAAGQRISMSDRLMFDP